MQKFFHRVEGSSGVSVGLNESIMVDVLALLKLLQQKRSGLSAKDTLPLRGGKEFIGTVAWLQNLVQYMAATGPWKAPFLTVRTLWSDCLVVETATGYSVSLPLHIYTSRLTFYLIAGTC
jgi:hypothetical protein